LKTLVLFVNFLNLINLNTMGRKSIGKVRKLEIINVFYKIAKKEGLENISIAKIADAMGVNPSLIIHYFKTKEELTYELITFILEKYLSLFKINTKVPIEKELITVIDNLFSKKWNRLIDDSLFYSCFALTYRNKKIKSQYKDLTTTLRENLAALLQRCMDAGLITNGNSMLKAELIFAIVDGAYFYLTLTSTTHQDFDKGFLNYKIHAYQVLGITQSHLS